MPELAPLLAAPDDDAPRLVHADALGGERGEFIVVQCELARGNLPRARALALRRRERALLAAHGAAWAGLDGLCTGWTFSRGFVDRVSVDARVCAARGEELASRAPLLRRLQLRGLTSDQDANEPSPLAFIRAVLQHPALQHVTHLDLGAPSIEWLHDGELSSYSRGEWVSDGAVALLIELGAIQRLRGLRLEKLTPSGLEALLTHPAAAALEALELQGAFGSEVTSRLLAQPLAVRPARLHLLDDGVVGVFENAMAQWVRHPLFSRVTDLRVGRLEPGDLAALLASPVASRLRALDAGLTLSHASLQAVATAPTLAALEVLHVSGAMASSVSLVERDGPVDHGPLCAETKLFGLRELHLNSAWVTDAVAQALVHSPLARQLVLLDLTNNPWMSGGHGSAWRRELDTELRLDPPRPR